MSVVQLNINGTDRTSQVDWTSLRKTEVLTYQPDNLSFTIRNVAGKTYRPSLNDDVKLYRNSTLIFAGVVISTSEQIDGLMRTFNVQCKDYTELLDGTLVAKAYSGMTGTAIINDLITNFAPAGFTTVNVNAPYTLGAIKFNYLSISQCLQALAQAIIGFDWYVDYNKDIHFFMPAGNSAPFGLNESTAGNFISGSLEYNADISQIKNRIVVRGGTTSGTTVTNSQMSDGSQIIYYVGYNLGSFAAYHAPVATPTVFTSLTVGRDGIDDPTAYGCLYNPSLGLLRFQTAYTAGDVVKTTGTPSFPLITIMSDAVSVAAYGVKQFVIVDNNISTKTESIDRANAELAQYSKPLYTGRFVTTKDGLVQGQYLNINLPSRGISGSFKIMQIDTTLRTPSSVTADFVYSVRFASALDIGIIEILNKLLITDKANTLQISANEIPDRVYGFNETITFTETIASSKVHNLHAETITFTEVVQFNKNYGTIFVAAPFNEGLINSDFTYQPTFVAATTSYPVWIDGTAGGSSSNSQWGWATAQTTSGSISARFDYVSGINCITIAATALSKAGTSVGSVMVSNIGVYPAATVATSSLTPALAVVAGASYTLSGNYYLQSISDSAHIAGSLVVVWYDSAGNRISTSQTANITSPLTTWTAISASVTAPTGAVYAVVTARCTAIGTDASGLSMTISWSNVSFTNAPTGIKRVFILNGSLLG